MDIMKLLHVDNSEFIKKNLKSALLDFGIEYDSCDRGSEVLSRLETSPCDLIVTGLELADGPGQAFVRRLNESPFRNIPVIVLTSHESLDLRTELFSLGVVDYLLKSEFTGDSLGRYIRALARDDAVMKDLRKMPVAVVDDSRLSLRIIRKIFDFHRVCNVDYFESAEGMLSDRNDYAIYILDMVLPGKSGEDLVLRLRDREQDSRIIMLSGLENYKTVSHILMSGADDFLLKPFDFSVFMSRVKANARTYSLIQHLKVAHS
jgi:two-component system cell cycle response regulator